MDEEDLRKIIKFLTSPLQFFNRKILKNAKLKIFKYLLFILKLYIKPIDPAVKPIIKKKENSAKSLGREFTIIFI